MTAKLTCLWRGSSLACILERVVFLPCSSCSILLISVQDDAAPKQDLGLGALRLKITQLKINQVVQQINRSKKKKVENGHLWKRRHIRNERRDSDRSLEGAGSRLEREPPATTPTHHPSSWTKTACCSPSHLGEKKITTSDFLKIFQETIDLAENQGETPLQLPR